MPVVESEVLVLESSATLAHILLTWRAPLISKTGRPTRQVEAVEPVSAQKRAMDSTQAGISPRPQLVQSVRRPRVCQCKVCERCLDNARWDRIFNEKFADPTYYGKLTVRHNSTLASI